MFKNIWIYIQLARDNYTESIIYPVNCRIEANKSFWWIGTGLKVSNFRNFLRAGKNWEVY